MNQQIQQKEIECKIDQIVIFDADNLHYTQAQQTPQNTEGTTNQNNNKNGEGNGDSHSTDTNCNNTPNKQQEQEDSDQILRIIKDKQCKGDPQLILKLQKQLRNTKQNLFNVTKIKQIIKKPKNQIKSLQSIQRVAEHTINSILKEGYMEKKTDGIIFKWKKRYFTLTPQKLFFFQSHKKEKVIGCINIKLIPLQVKQENGQILLDFQGESENIYLKCQNKQQTQSWKQWLNQVSKYQSKQKKYLLKTMNKPFYSETNTMSQRQFMNQSQTGDVLLFYTNHIGAKLQRVFTGSDFDHVAMVVKFRSYQLMIFQSNTKNGVALFQWNQYIRCCNLYEKITYRKLNSPRKAQIQHNLLKFVKGNLGRNYQLNLSKFFTFESDFNWQALKQDTTRGYFCSELLAKAYKGIGLLDPKKSSTRYWPVDFSQKNQLQFITKGTYLGPQQHIILNKHVKKVV